jgi:2-polyprenyl-3-methyl-5-hydroxy-6-metoxy-1,4-benzoquinol methylase
VTDRSNGYEGVSAEFLAGRGRAPPTAIGTTEVRAWARELPRGAAVLDLACGPGIPITQVLVAEGLSVYGVDAAPSFVEAFKRNLPGVPVACEPVEDSTFFDRQFDGVLAWGLMFLLAEADQRRLIRTMAGLLVPAGRLLFTSPAQVCAWNDAMTGLRSLSLGAVEYRKELASLGVQVRAEYEDAGRNHYFDAIKSDAIKS